MSRHQQQAPPPSDATKIHHTSASAQSQSLPPMPRPRLQRAATACQETIQLPIVEQNFQHTDILPIIFELVLD
jgi:hypothetical protein